jgi:hypothetical protein
MHTTRTIDREPQQDHPYTPTPDGFERCERGWVHRPEPHRGDHQEVKAPSDEETIPEAEDMALPEPHAS